MLCYRFVLESSWFTEDACPFCFGSATEIQAPLPARREKNPNHSMKAHQRWIVLDSGKAGGQQGAFGGLGAGQESSGQL